MPTSEDGRFVNKSSRAETGTVCGTASFSNMESQAGGVGKNFSDVLSYIEVTKHSGVKRWWSQRVIEHLSREYTLVFSLGFFDHEAGRVECAPNPFGAKLLPMSPEG